MAQNASALNFENLIAKDNIFATHNLENVEFGTYLWICTRVPLKDTDSADFNNGIYIRTNTFDVPMVEPQIKDGLFCYRSVNAL
jgi:hypothetical protein